MAISVGKGSCMPGDFSMGADGCNGVSRATSCPRRVMQKASPRSTEAMSLEKFWLASRSEISWNFMGNGGPASTQWRLNSGLDDFFKK